MASVAEIAGTGAFFTGSIFIAMVPPVARAGGSGNLSGSAGLNAYTQQEAA
jgi:hypothetical protein